MSGIIGGKNHRGSGLIADLGTDGQVLTSAGAGLRQVFESASSGITSKIRTGSFTIATAGALAITGAGFEPSGVLFGITRDSHAAMSIGWSDSATGAEANIYDYNGVSADAYNTNSADLWTLYVSSGNYAVGGVTSYDADGATFYRTVTGSPAGDAFWMCMFIK